MKWTPITVNEVTTSNPVYFDEKHASVCKRICQVLHIDCFPAVGELAYYRLVEDKWLKKSIDYDICLIDTAFEPSLLEKFEGNDSNIVFTHKNKLINGIIHFTNYESPHIYSTIYHNLNIFEKNLRNHLIEKGFNDDKLIEYYEVHKLKTEKNKEWVHRKIKDLKSSEDKRPFEKAYLKDLIDFSLSKYHGHEKLAEIGTSFFKEEVIDKKNCFGSTVGVTINKLRNFIMHHDNISGESDFTPHNFNEFKKFFNSVNVFKEGFDKLRKERLKNKLNSIHITNSLKLEIVDNLSDEQIKNYFYN